MSDPVVYRASELGGCSRFLIAKRMGYTLMPPPLKFQGYFERGQNAEDWAVERMTERGFVFRDRQKEVDLPIYGNVIVRGHIDGVVSDIDGDNEYLWECKRVSPQVYKSFQEHGWDAKYDLLDRYKWQTSVYMIATGLELRLELICETDEQVMMMPLFREIPFYTDSQIISRVIKLEALAQNGDLPETCDKPNYPCPVYYLPGHDEEDQDERDEVVEELAKAVVEATGVAKAAKDAETRLRAELLTALGDRERVRGDEVTVSKQQSSRTITDWDKMREDGIDLRKYQRKEKGVWFARVTPRKKTDDDTTDES